MTTPAVTVSAIEELQRRGEPPPSYGLPPPMDEAVVSEHRNSTREEHDERVGLEPEG